MSLPRVFRNALASLAALALAAALVTSSGCASWTIPDQEFRDTRAKPRNEGEPQRPTAKFGSSDKARAIESNVGIR